MITTEIIKDGIRLKTEIRELPVNNNDEDNSEWKKSLRIITESKRNLESENMHN